MENARRAPMLWNLNFFGASVKRRALCYQDKIKKKEKKKKKKKIFLRLTREM
jgi:hypothetical protein